MNDPGLHDLSSQNSFASLCYFKAINVETNGLVDQVAHNLLGIYVGYKLNKAALECS